MASAMVDDGKNLVEAAVQSKIRVLFTFSLIRSLPLLTCLSLNHQDLRHSYRRDQNFGVVHRRRISKVG